MSDDGLVEVNKALQNLYLTQGEKSVVDLQDAFIQLRDSSNLDYSYELLRRNSSGIMTPLSAEDLNGSPLSIAEVPFLIEKKKSRLNQ